MCSTRSRSDSSTYGCFSVSESNLQSFPSLLLISALCMSGYSNVIFRLSSWAHTMNAFIGLLMCSFFDRGSPTAATAATSDSCKGIGDSAPIASARELKEAVEVLVRLTGSAGLGEDAGEEETGEGVGEPASLAVEEEKLLLTLVEVPMLCTRSTIILSVTREA